MIVIFAEVLDGRISCRQVVQVGWSCRSGVQWKWLRDTACSDQLDGIRPAPEHYVQAL